MEPNKIISGAARTSVATTPHSLQRIPSLRPHTNTKRTLSSSPHVKQGRADTVQSSSSHAVAMMPPVAVVLAVSSSLQPQAAAQAQPPTAPGPAPAPSWGELDCTGALLNLSSCLTYVEAGSSLTRPEKGCCGALSGVVDGPAACLCGLVGGYGAYGVRVDAVRALALPTICRVEAPPPRLCAALGVPVAEPPGGAGPAQSGDGIPTTPATPAANGGPANSRRHMCLALLPYCIALFTPLL